MSAVASSAGIHQVGEVVDGHEPSEQLEDVGMDSTGVAAERW
jgi:hypothetical protein